jgi:hypothetical protein
MKFENTSVMNFENAFRGLRNPKNSWNRSDSNFNDYYDLLRGDISENELKKVFPSAHVHHRTSDGYFVDIIGANDMKLAQRLIKAGNEHRKFMRQIFVSVDITAPLYWWKEFDTYKVGTVANSTSTMHKLATTPITLDCFEIDDYDRDLSLADNPKDDDELDNISTFEEDIIYVLENIRQKYLETKDKRYWKELVRWLPESWLQTRTVTMNYENIRNMYFQRRNHKLTEWSESFVKWVETLPYAEELIIYED